MIKNVVIIGSGNVAEALALAIRNVDGYTVVQVMARNPVRGFYVAGLAGATYTGMHEGVPPADIYLIAVSDNSIAKVSEMPGFRDAVVAHTAGSVGIDELSFGIENRGVFYPLQTFTSGIPVDFTSIPLFIEGVTKKAEKELHKLAAALSEKVYPTSSRQRLALHAAAVFASNFTNHMYASAQGILAEHGLPAGVLQPLIAETARKAGQAPEAAEVQTGPAVRGDSGTVAKHMELLENNKELQELYKLISSNIWETSKKISRK